MLAILGPLGALLGLEIGSLKARLQRQVIVYGVLGALGLVAVSFILVSINSALTYAVGPVIAPLIIAAAALFIALVVFLVFHFRENAEREREAEKKHSAEITALITTAAITALPLIIPTMKKIGLPAGGALAAAYSLMQAKALRRHR